MSDLNKDIVDLTAEKREGSITPGRLGSILKRILDQITTAETTLREEIAAGGSGGSGSGDGGSGGMIVEELSGRVGAIESSVNNAVSVAGTASENAASALATVNQINAEFDNLKQRVAKLEQILSTLNDIWLGTENELPAASERDPKALYFVKASNN